MIKNKNLIYRIVITFVLIVFAIFVWKNYQFQFQKRPDKPIKLPPQNSRKCGIENCHGLNITCGPNIPKSCDLMYAAGDNCRQFVSCQIVGNQCELKKSPQFDSCKTCVEKCEQDYSDDQIKFFACEKNALSKRINVPV